MKHLPYSLEVDLHGNVYLFSGNDKDLMCRADYNNQKEKDILYNMFLRAVSVNTNFKLNKDIIEAKKDSKELFKIKVVAG